MTEHNDSYYPLFTIWGTTGGIDGNARMIPSLSRRNSVQPLSFMDFSFFPVCDEAPADMADKLSTTTMTPLVAAYQPGISAIETAIHQQEQQHEQVDNHQILFQADHQASASFFRSNFVDDHSEGSEHVSEPSLAASSLDSSEDSVMSSSKRLMFHSEPTTRVSVEDGSGQRFKPFHEEKWGLRYKELLEFHRVNGHAAVPHTYPKNPQLARWVKRQRRQFKLLKEGKASTMTTERLDLLDSVGFVWDSHEINWREKLEILTAFRAHKGHCNVPSNFPDKKLATWVKCQRRQYKLYWDGKPSAMSLDRVAALERIGFEWGIRSTGGSKSHTSISESIKAPIAIVKEGENQDECEPEPLPVHFSSVVGTQVQLYLAEAFDSL